MRISKRNPIIRINNSEFEEVVGTLGNDLNEQNLESIEGGSTPSCAVASVVVASIGLASKVYSDINEAATAKYKCGGVWTVTADCFDC